MQTANGVRRVTVEMTNANFDWLSKIVFKSGRSMKYVLNRLVQCTAEGKAFRVTPPMKLHKGRRIKVEAAPWEPEGTAEVRYPSLER